MRKQVGSNWQFELIETIDVVDDVEQFPYFHSTRPTGAYRYFIAMIVSSCWKSSHQLLTNNCVCFHEKRIKTWIKSQIKMWLPSWICRHFSMLCQMTLILRFCVEVICAAKCSHYSRTGAVDIQYNDIQDKQVASSGWGLETWRSDAITNVFKVGHHTTVRALWAVESFACKLGISIELNSSRSSNQELIFTQNPLQIIPVKTNKYLCTTCLLVGRSSF